MTGNPVYVKGIRDLVVEAVDHFADKKGLKEVQALDVVAGLTLALAEVIKKCPHPEVRAELALGAAQALVHAGQGPVYLPRRPQLVGHA